MPRFGWQEWATAVTVGGAALFLLRRLMGRRHPRAGRGDVVQPGATLGRALKKAQRNKRKRALRFWAR